MTLRSVAKIVSFSAVIFALAWMFGCPDYWSHVKPEYAMAWAASSAYALGVLGN